MIVKIIEPVIFSPLPLAGWRGNGTAPTTVLARASMKAQRGEKRKAGEKAGVVNAPARPLLPRCGSEVSVDVENGLKPEENESAAAITPQCLLVFSWWFLGFDSDLLCKKTAGTAVPAVFLLKT